MQKRAYCLPLHGQVKVKQVDQGPKLPSAKADSCSYDNITAYLEPCQPTVKVQLHGGDMVELPLGNYQFTRRDNSTNCTYHVAVARSPVSKRLVFRSEYDITCASLNTGSDTSFLDSVLAQRRDELQDICIQALQRLYSHSYHVY
ncbi:hypothetical protein EB796_017106 [Bugula neritina]|uniref:Uncharacterized protein n=1 Tax=Bugula neritina TaxID=10212 RepID=A0A7J7JFY5_BUGNE|nr:hypothetical protein EB796_017106 [Bugula neritina]